MEKRKLMATDVESIVEEKCIEFAKKLASSMHSEIGEFIKLRGNQKSTWRWRVLILNPEYHSFFSIFRGKSKYVELCAFHFYLDEKAPSDAKIKKLIVFTNNRTYQTTKAYMDWFAVSIHPYKSKDFKLNVEQYAQV